MAKYWHCREFSMLKGAIESLDRETLLKNEVLPFLNEMKLHPSDCGIFYHVDGDLFQEEHRRKPKIVYQVFYTSDSPLI